MACFIVEMELIIELLTVELISFPQLSSILSRNLLNLFPFSLKLFYFFIVLVGLFRRSSSRFDFLNDGLFALEVFLFFCLLFSSRFGAKFANQVVFCLKGFFICIGSWLEIFSSTAIFNKLLASSHNFCAVIAIVSLLEGFEVGATDITTFLGYFFQTLQDFCLSGGGGAFGFSNLGLRLNSFCRYGGSFLRLSLYRLVLYFFSSLVFVHCNNV